MGTIIPRGSKWRAVIRRKGITATKTFSKKALARDWMIRAEAKIEVRQVFAKGNSLGSILDRYRTEIVEPRYVLYKRGRPGKPSGRTHYHLKMLARQHGTVDLTDMTKDWWIDTIKEMDVAPGSRHRYMNVIAGALAAAESLWDIEVDWASYRRARKLLAKLGIIAKGRRRNRRLQDGELDQILDHVRGKTVALSQDYFRFAIELAMRCEEISLLLWKDYDKRKKMIWVRDRKHPETKMGNDWHVPLLGDSADIIERQPRISEYIFPLMHKTAEHHFREARKAAAISDLHFHDLRHEAISRLFERGYAIEEVALVSGHTDWASLKIYTNLSPESLHSGPASRRVVKR